MSLFGNGLLLAGLARSYQRMRTARDPRAAQEKALFALLRSGERTGFGREHGFSRIRSVAEYRRRVPLRSYPEFLPWFERALTGERDVSWPGKIRYFGMTSGTTAGNKYLPVSDASVAQQRRGGFEPLA